MIQNSNLIEIDGSYGEGGGQILRTALSLSAVTKKPCYIFNIRKNRENPGIATQHLVGMQALAKLFNAEIEGDEIHSQEIIFEPNDIYLKEIDLKIETAESITLVLQMILLPILVRPSSAGSEQVHPVKIKFKGGATDTFFSPTIDYFRYVFMPILEKLINELPSHKNGKVEINILKRGFYPKGGADIENNIFPIEFSQKISEEFKLTERGELKRILLISGASESLKEKKVSEKQLNGAHQTPLFYKKAHLPLETKVEYYESFCSESQLTIIGEFEKSILGTSILGKPQKSSEEVGREAAMEFLKETRGENAIDSHLADQILPYIALFTKSAKITTSEVTEHAKTNMWVIEKFIKGSFKVENNTIFWKS